MECTKCYKIFTRGDNLHRHMKIHDRPYAEGDGSRSYQNTTETKNVHNDGDIVNVIRKLIERLDQYYHIECIKKGRSLTDIVKELKEDHGIYLLKEEKEGRKRKENLC